MRCAVRSWLPWPALLAAALLLAAPSTAHAAGGVEVDQQGAPAMGMGGAFTAVANDPSAIYFNPAGLGFQPGFSAQAGGNIIIVRTHVEPDNITLWHTTPAPTLYASQRFGDHVAFGIGGFGNFGEHFSFSPNWRGRFVGYFIDLQTYTIQPTLALRLWSWLSVGVGIDVVRASFDLYRGLNFGAAEGSVHAGGDDTGIGGNVGVLLRIIPRHLNLGFSYRSRVDINFDAHGAVTAPPELAAMVPQGVQPASAHLPLPHNFSVGLAGFVGHLIVSVDVKVTLWRDLQSLTLTLGDASTTTSAMPAAAASSSLSLPLDLHNAWALRVGAQYGFFRDFLRVRVGAGYDQTPLPQNRLGPLLPDTDRGNLTLGLGLHWKWLSLDAAYLAVWLVPKTSTDPDLTASYSSFGQVISGSLTVQFENVLQHHRVFQPEEY